VAGGAQIGTGFLVKVETQNFGDLAKLSPRNDDFLGRTALVQDYLLMKFGHKDNLSLNEKSPTKIGAK